VVSAWHWVADASLFVAAAGLLFDDIRFRRKIQRELAQDAARMLTGVNVVAGIELPHPNDPRWVYAELSFTTGVTHKKEGTLSIGTIVVTVAPPNLFIGLASPRLEAGDAYAKAVVHAYRKRTVAEALKS
jgi:hypothetical protein